MYSPSAARMVEFWISLPEVLTHSSVLRAWRSVQIAKTLRKARREPRTINPLTVLRRQGFIELMLYVGHEARGHSPHHCNNRERAAERRLLRGRAGAAPGEENREPGQPDRLPPLLRRRGGRSRRRPDLLRVPGRGARTGRCGDGAPDRLAGRLGRFARLLGGAPRRARDRH